MSPRQARRERREAERKAKKAEIRRLKIEETAAPSTIPEAADFPPEDRAIFKAAHERYLQKRAEINRANAQFSTGPRTERGKLASSRNSLKHGLASGELIIDDEDPSDYQQLLKDLVDEHQPANPTEELLINEMAQSWWLTQRAIRLQNLCFAGNSFDERRFALFLRYQTTHERAFHKALNTLIRLQKDRQKSSQKPKPSAHIPQLREESDTSIGFVSQNAPESVETPSPHLQSAAS